jgi:hypothetical protein
MKIIILFVSVVLLSGFAELQNRKVIRKPAAGVCKHVYDPSLKKEIYTSVDKMPAYPGKRDAFLSYFEFHFQYPGDMSKRGEIHLEFVVDTDGKIIGEKIKNKKTSDLDAQEKDGIKVLKSSGKWIPGKCNGKVVPVRTYFDFQY